MVDERRYEEEQAWEKLRAKSLKRQNASAVKTRARLPFWLITIGLLGILGCVIASGVIDSGTVQPSVGDVPALSDPGTTAGDTTAATQETVSAETESNNGPQFSGLTELYIQSGDTVSYKSGVKATDVEDGELSFTVDTNGFDNKTPGHYTVYYIAVDKDGHETKAPRTIVVESLTGLAVKQYAQEVLDEIIKPDMTRDEKIYAVYAYPRWNVYYIGNSDKSSLENAAYEGFTKYAGDCYTYYAMVKVMLDMLEIENLTVTRIEEGSASRHWWSLVLFEDGKYYHVDASPPGVRVAEINHAKMTEADLAAYTEIRLTNKPKPNYYVYDKTLPEYQNIEIA